MLLIVLLALAAALLYGVADFMGGVAARRIPVVIASTINYAVATLVLIVAVLAVGGVWSTTAIVGGVVAGVLAAVAFLTFYAALAAGPISLMTPLIALLSSAVPVVVALVLGDRLQPIAWIAIAVAIVGSMLIGIERRDGARAVKRRTLVFAVISGLGFGFATVALDSAPADAGMVPVFLDTTVGFVLLVALVGLARITPALQRVVGVLDAHVPTDLVPHLAAAQAPGAARLAPDGIEAVEAVEARRRARVLAAGAGLLIGGANVLLMIALHAGSVAVVAVLVNLYPVATVLLAWIVLRERVNAVQGTGIVLAVAASVMLGLA